MRVTFQTLTSGTINRLMARSRQLEQANNRLASGKMFTRPSEDPAAANRATTLRSTLSDLDSYDRTISDATARLDAADLRLGQAMAALHRVKEITISASTGTTSDTGVVAIIEELSQLRDQIAAIANSRYLDGPLFAGFQTTDAVTEVAGTWTFTGTPAEALNRQVSSTDVVQINVTAGEAFAFGGDDVFTMIDDIIADLQAGDRAAAGAANTRIDAAREQLSAAQSRIGAAANRVEEVKSRNDGLRITVRAELAKVEDVDLEQAITEVSRQEAAYQAALGAAAKSIQPSLVDWLR